MNSLEGREGEEKNWKCMNYYSNMIVCSHKYVGAAMSNLKMGDTFEVIIDRRTRLLENFPHLNPPQFSVLVKIITTMLILTD